MTKTGNKKVSYQNKEEVREMFLPKEEIDDEGDLPIVKIVKRYGDYKKGEIIEVTEDLATELINRKKVAKVATRKELEEYQGKKLGEDIAKNSLKNRIPLSMCVLRYYSSKNLKTS